MRIRPRSEIETKAASLLDEAGVSHAPVPVERIAERLNLRVEPATLGDDVSGILVVAGDKGTIGYNSSQAYVRQRFSIAHEVGHFVLHRREEDIFIDKGYTATVFRRDLDSSSGEHRREVEANRFAAALLMPENLVRQAVAALDFDLGDELALASLARQFQVSSQALSHRLSNLAIFNGESDQ